MTYQEWKTLILYDKMFTVFKEHRRSEVNLIKDQLICDALIEEFKDITEIDLHDFFQKGREQLVFMKKNVPISKQGPMIFLAGNNETLELCFYMIPLIGLLYNHPKITFSDACMLILSRWLNDLTTEQSRDFYVRVYKILIEILDYPFLDVKTLEPFRTEKILQLAHSIEETKNFEALPILADALEEVGCQIQPILEHLREKNSKRLPGCWSLQMITKYDLYFKDVEPRFIFKEVEP